MKLIFSLMRRGSSSSARTNSVSAGRPASSSAKVRRQANVLMDSVGRMEDRG